MPIQQYEHMSGTALTMILPEIINLLTLLCCGNSRLKMYPNFGRCPE